MDAASKAEKLSLARKKLKEFESRKNQPDSPSPSVTSSSAAHDHQNFNGRSSVVSEKSASISFDNQNGSLHPDTSNGNMSISSNASPMPQAPFVNGSAAASVHSAQGETDRLYAILREKDVAYDQVKGQLQDLHGYYSQLHAAYSDLSQKGSNGGSEQHNFQIMQLQSALSVLVSEKTTLQSELRKAKDELQENKSQLSSNRSSHAEHAARSERAQVEVGKLQAELNDKNRMLERRLTELENERKESSRLQAQMLNLQHDRNEAQARLKNVYRDKEALEIEFKNLRKDCQMKDLYIKQLTAHQNIPHGSEEVDIHKLNEECDALRAEVARLQTESTEAKREAEDARTHYNEYGKQMNENYARLNKEFDEVSSSKFTLEVRLRELEDQLELTRNDLLNAKHSSNHSGELENQTTPHDSVSICDEDVSRKVDDALRRCNYTWERKMEMREKEIEDLIQEKDRNLFEREQSIAELQMRVRLLEEREKEARENSSDLLTISEQLQNEKATVSRAVAQNRELKEQLIETEDRLIALTEEKLQSELARQTAEHQVKQLNLRFKKLEQMGISISSESSSREVSVEPVVDEQPKSLAPSLIQTNDEDTKSTAKIPESESSDDDDDNSVTTSGPDDVIDGRSVAIESTLARQLEETQRQLEEVRNELRRSHTQNQEMNQIMRQNAEDENQNSIHVELGQAVSRINELAQENEHLRTELNTTLRSLENNHSLINSTASPSSETDDTSFSHTSHSVSATDATSSTHDLIKVDVETIAQKCCILSGENDDLREEVNRLNRLLSDVNSQLESTRIEENFPTSRENPPVSPLLESDLLKHSVGTAEWARVELEKRFAEAMHRVADLKEQCDKLEHINVQLQLENDTIADHVILYQHQRRLIRERLRQKDEQMAVLERERERVSGRCQELQEALMSVLGEAGALKEYQKSSRRVRSKRPVSRSYSHSTVDELSGDEECIVDARNQEIPPRSEVQLLSGEEPIPEESADNKENVETILTNGTVENETLRSTASSPVSRPQSPRRIAKEAAVQRILDIITEIRTPVVSPIDNRMQCKQCIGEMQIL